MKVDMRIKGTAACVRNIKKFGTVAEKELGFAMAKVVLKVTRSAREHAPEDTGYLKSTINPIPAIKKRPGRAIHGYVTATAKYAAIQEFGGHGYTAHRYMIKGLADNATYIKNSFKDHIVKAALTVRAKNVVRGE